MVLILGITSDLPDGPTCSDWPVGDGLMIPIVYRGQHAFPVCRETPDGWICDDDDCTVDPIPSVGLRRTCAVDDLIGVVEEVRAHWYRRWRVVPVRKIHWRLVRESARQTFVNGRSMRVAGCDLVRETWWSGITRTKRGARKQMAAHADLPRHGLRL
jgi:hypothetical protein